MATSSNFSGHGCVSPVRHRRFVDLDIRADSYPHLAVVTGSSDKQSEQPGLIFFFSGSSGRCRRVESFLAQVLQRRANHGTFKMYSVDVEKHPALAERFKVGDVPVLCVVENKTVKRRLDQPRSGREIEAFLAPWLR